MSEEIKKCECGYFHIYKKSWVPFANPKPLQYLYRDIFCEAWVNRSFLDERHARLFSTKTVATGKFFWAGEYCDKIENICQLKD